MADTTQFTIGVKAVGTDGEIGKVSRVVVDPTAQAVTHIVVEPKVFTDISRLVPLALVRGATADEVTLTCSLAEFGKLPPAEETKFLPGISQFAGYGPGEVLTWPYYGLALDGGEFSGGLGGGDLVTPVTTDKVPLGEVAIWRNEHVHATDGEIGRVQGLVIDTGNRHVTHVLLQEGHLWGRKEVAIPVSAVTKVDEEGIKLNLDKQQVQDLPPVNVDRADG
jgi:sporulation protein YlmC with PRC-barrel domain